MTAFTLRRNEIRLAADLLARAEAWVEQAAPELQADIARTRTRLLIRADRLMDWPSMSDPLPIGDRSGSHNSGDVHSPSAERRSDALWFSSTGDAADGS